MARARSSFVCSECGHGEPKWQGRCPGCGAWNTMAEERVAPAARVGAATAVSVRPLREVDAVAVRRMATGIGELDRVLGGGLVPGSLVLLGGSPGIGKSTMTTMALANLAAAGREVLYVSAEESPAQVRLRAERLAPAALDVPVLAETSLDVVLATLEARRPQACVVDSVQTLHADGLSGAPGSVGQVREVAGAIMRVAKRAGTAVLLVGHVTKEGALAGPRVLEHLVDCVLQFEGERERTYRTLRALKNRFGSVDETGVFEMRDAGLVEVLDASARFVAEATRAPGSLVLAAMEGTRPLLVEVQALVSESELVPPRRVVSGIDRNRLALVLALELQHAVDQVLEHARPGQCAVLRHVADEQHGDRARLGQPGDPVGDLSDLAHGAGRPAQLRGVERLHRVDHADLGALGVERGDDRLEIGLRQDRDLERRAREALGS